MKTPYYYGAACLLAALLATWLLPACERAKSAQVEGQAVPKTKEAYMKAVSAHHWRLDMDTVRHYIEGGQKHLESGVYQLLKERGETVSAEQKEKTVTLVRRLTEQWVKNLDSARLELTADGINRAQKKRHVDLRYTFNASLDTMFTYFGTKKEVIKGLDTFRVVKLTNKEFVLLRAMPMPYAKKDYICKYRWIPE